MSSCFGGLWTLPLIWDRRRCHQLSTRSSQSRIQRPSFWPNGRRRGSQSLVEKRAFFVYWSSAFVDDPIIEWHCAAPTVSNVISFNPTELLCQPIRVPDKIAQAGAMIRGCLWLTARWEIIPKNSQHCGVDCGVNCGGTWRWALMEPKIVTVHQSSRLKILWRDWWTILEVISLLVAIRRLAFCRSLPFCSIVGRLLYRKNLWLGHVPRCF